MLFAYKLTYNESQEVDGSENFSFPYKYEGVIKVESFEDAFEFMKDSWKHLSNGEWYWECNDEGTKGEVRFHNGEDGMSVAFDVWTK